MAWFASPTSGEVDAFGEVLIEVITRSTGLNARDAPYVAKFDLHSDDVCVCRSQTLQMTIELIVTAGTSAANSYIEIIDSNNVEASGELTFYIVPVDDEGLLIRDSGAVQFSPVITWVGHHGPTVRRRRPLDEIVVVCSVKFLTALDVHEGSCRMPTLDGAPLAGSFALSAELASGEQVGGSDYSVEVTSCPKDWFYHKPTGACNICDLEKSECRGGRELPVPKRGYWSDLANADLGFVCATTVPDHVAAVTHGVQPSVRKGRVRAFHRTLAGTRATTRTTATAGCTTMALALKARPGSAPARLTCVPPRPRARYAENASGSTPIRT